jgi:hypothetical protein
MTKALLKVLFACGLLTLLCSTSVHSENPGKKSSAPEKPPAQEQRGTKDSPLFIKQIPTPKTEEESAQDAQERKEKTANDRKLVQFTGILALVGFLQLVVFGLQSYYLRKTVLAAGEQGEDMKRAIAETSRSATATEKVAKHIESNLETDIQQSKSMEESVAEAARLAAAMEQVAKDIAVSSQAATASVSAIGQQMRAYICVVVGTAIYQERGRSMKFQAVPSIVNAGLTPASKVSFQAKAAILPSPLPDDFKFPLPGIVSGTLTVGPRQAITASPWVDDFVDDSEVEGIKNASSGKCLYTWGLLTYEDIFGKTQYTKWCHSYTWLADGKTTWGYYDQRHNDAS